MSQVNGRDNAHSGWSGSDAWVRLGVRIVLALIIFVVGFGWLVKINGAVVTSGTVTVENRYQTVQHLDGGIVGRIHVRNGDRVTAGDVLITLDKTTDRAELSVITSRIDELLVQRARLAAERDGGDRFELPQGITVTPQIRQRLESQQALFQARLASRNGESSMLSRRVEQLSAQLKGLEVQRAARVQEEELARKELEAIRGLFAKGYTNRQRLTAAERDAARLKGDIGRLSSDVARVNVAISEAKLRLAQSRKTFIESVLEELRTVRQSLNELEERQKALNAKVSRGIIRAPRGGLVHALAVNTEGGVIEPAKPILQIVPEGERFIVEARVRPQDIDKVRSGLPADIRFPAFNARETPRLTGSVLRISAAELKDSSGGTFFTALITLTGEEMKRLGASRRLVPGMPAEVFIRTDARSILSYVLKPLTDSMFHALR
ncbi:MAG: HlyD family type I secretion periplasmic adaptor subunit [Pseudomonadota bacterium]